MSTGPIYRAIRPLLFALPPEQSHRLAGWMLAAAVRTPGLRGALHRMNRVEDPALASTLFGLRFPNPVGLAAGWDKDARYVMGMPLLGMGFTEVGTVTPRPQPGNPPPRLFRLKKWGALLNRMGFNNEGCEAMARRLEAVRRRGPAPIPIGVNIGKNRDTPLLEAASDYVASLERLHGLADYLVVNVSSPNTPGLRDLQAPELLASLLAEIVPRAAALRESESRPPLPVLVKLSPDTAEEDLPAIARVAERAGAAGFVATNTTSGRPDVGGRWESEAGGLSGRPLQEVSTRMIARLFGLTAGRLPIIGVGGVFDAEDAYRKIRAGASLVQVYTGLIYQGPTLAARICRGLLERMRRDRFAELSEVVGSGAADLKG